MPLLLPLWWRLLVTQVLSSLYQVWFISLQLLWKLTSGRKEPSLRPCPRPDQQVAVVTGATSGIGLACARSLARLGFKVVVAGRSPERSLAACREVEAHAGREGCAVPLVVDVGVMASVRHFVARCGEAVGRVDVLVNNAGVVGEQGVTVEGLDPVAACNFAGTVLLTDLFKTILKPGARVIQVGSFTYRFGREEAARGPLLKEAEGALRVGMQGYYDSKLAMTLCSLELARRWGQQSLPFTLSIVDPGTAVTGIMRSFNGVLDWLLGSLPARAILISADMASWTVLQIATGAVQPKSLSKGCGYFLRGQEIGVTKRVQNLDTKYAKDLLDVTLERLK